MLRELRRPKKIAVCTAWGSPFTWTHAAYNLMNLLRPEGVQVKFLPGMGRDPARRHMWGVERALKWGATHICFLGADQLHDLDILLKFSDHVCNGWPVVTALVPTRGFVRAQGVDEPFRKFAWTWKDEQSRNHPVFDHDHLRLITPRDGVYPEVVVVGTGALMFDTALLGRMKKPWFVEPAPDENAYRPASMDTTFCWRLVTEAGARILCDTTIQVVHLDVFPIDETYGKRFSDWPTRKPDETLHRYM